MDINSKREETYNALKTKSYNTYGKATWSFACCIFSKPTTDSGSVCENRGSNVASNSSNELLRVDNLADTLLGSVAIFLKEMPFVGAH